MRPTTKTATSVGVRIRNISKSFGKTEVLKSVDLNIQPGEFFTIIGPSGCGKTTLLRIISGFYQPTAGSVLFNEKDVTYLPPWDRNIGFVFQNYALWPNMTVFNNVAYGLKIRKKPMDVIRDRVKWALEVVDLSGVERQHPDQLSGGMQQRVAIARAIVIDPSLLLLDEPLSNLDAKLRVSLRKHIREIQTDLAITAVYVTHDQEEALEISDRIAILNEGELQQFGRPEDVYENPSNHFVAGFLGEANIIEGSVTASGYFEAGSVKLDVSGNRPDINTRATLIVRPENIQIVNGGNGHVEATLVKRYYLGALKRFVAQLDDGTTLYLGTFNDHAVGEKVWLEFGKMRLICEEEVHVSA
ncbi:MAG TPA: ABC transporter ATP-binding protein [Clostridiaceae bacterium]|nr:ABC transporter ATP-binding protein [Clostridiaceae bacterium]